MQEILNSSAMYLKVLEKQEQTPKQYAKIKKIKIRAENNKWKLK